MINDGEPLYEVARFCVDNLKAKQYDFCYNENES